MIRTLLTTFLIGASHLLFAQTNIFVDARHTGVGDGTKNSPYSNIELAAKQATKLTADSVVVNVAKGNYFLKNSIAFDGSNQTPIRIVGSGDGASVISGAIEVRDWSWGEGGLLVSKIDDATALAIDGEQLYINNSRAIRAKSPDKGWYYLDSTQQVIHHKGSGRVAKFATQRLFTPKENIAQLANLSPQELSRVVAMFYHKWDNTRKYIDYLEPETPSFYISGSGMKPWNSLDNQTRFTLENFKGAISTQGEYYLDSDGWLYYYPREGETPQNIVGYIPVLKRLITINGTQDKLASNIAFENITFAHSAYTMPKSGNAPEQAAASIEAAIEINYAQNIEFNNCEIKHTGGYALWFKNMCRNSHIKHSYIYDLGAGGVKVGEPHLRDDVPWYTNNITIENNIIQSAGHILPCGIGVGIMFAADNKVIHNEISDILYSGVSVGWMWGYKKSGFVTRIMNKDGELREEFGHFDNPSTGNEIAFNHIHHIGWGELSDMGAVYTLGESYDTHIHHNVIHDVYTYSYGGWGLYTDEGSSGVTMENNLVWGCKSGGFHQHYGKENIIRNNIFAFSHICQLKFTRVEEHKSFTFSNNIVTIDHGDILGGDWEKAKVDMHDNMYWDSRVGHKVTLLNRELKEWQELKDSGSVVADPMFKDPYNFDFTIENKRAIKKIGFTPFDYSKAGVYGSKQWKERAKLPSSRTQTFKQIVREKEEEYSKIYEQ